MCEKIVHIGLYLKNIGITSSLDNIGPNWSPLTRSVFDRIAIIEEELSKGERFASVDEIQAQQDLFDQKLIDLQDQIDSGKVSPRLGLHFKHDLLKQGAVPLAVLHAGKVMGDRDSGIPSCSFMRNYLDRFDELDRYGSAPIRTRTTALISVVGDVYRETARQTETYYSALKLFRGGQEWDEPQLLLPS